MRGPIRPLLNSLIVVGLIIAAWPVGQTVYGRWSQQKLAAQWQAQQNSLGHRVHPTKVVHNPDSPAPMVSRRSKKRPAWPLTKFTIPDLNLVTYVVQGMDLASLKRGPGHDPYSSPPGRGNCVIAGHRNIYGSFFYEIDKLAPGAPIVLENKYGKWTYTVSSVFSTPDTNFDILKETAPGETPALTLITCTLPHSNDRFIVRAELQKDNE